MDVDSSSISTKMIYYALGFYAKQGFQMIDVPMCVSKEAIEATLPPHVKVLPKGGKYYVGSAEQSFIELHKQGKLTDGKYMALTPCERVEPVLDDLHYTTFLKLELIEINPRRSCWDPLTISSTLFDDVQEFYQSLDVETVLEETEEGHDLLLNGIEVGSYGQRKMLDGTIYLYGTGLAEPRTSFAIQQGK